MICPELEKVIIECQKELSNARKENINMEGEVRTVEQHLFKAMEILQNVLPPIDCQAEDKD